MWVAGGAGGEFLFFWNRTVSRCQEPPSSPVSGAWRLWRVSDKIKAFTRHIEADSHSRGSGYESHTVAPEEPWDPGGSGGRVGAFDMGLILLFMSKFDLQRKHDTRSRSIMGGKDIEVSAEMSEPVPAALCQNRRRPAGGRANLRSASDIESLTSLVKAVELSNPIAARAFTVVSVFPCVAVAAAGLFGEVRPQGSGELCPGGASCNPHIGDLMVGRAAQLSASSTCGLDGPQNYCIIGYLEEEQKCFSCDSRRPFDAQSNPNSHRIENVITTFEPERKMKWWQSENGIHDVSIRLDLEAVFQFSHLVLTFKSFRPVAMLVERSQDFGRTWKVFRYFSEDCSVHFPRVSDQTPDSVDDVVCDGRYSGSEPSTEGEVVLKALDPIFEIEDPYAPHIQELITMTNLRVNFTRLFMLGDTLLGRKRRDPQEKYYYALYEMVVRGSCFCNGHAAQCAPAGGRGDVFTEPGMVHGQCVCQHNTAGLNCERCQDFHHDSPWRPGGDDNAGVCRRCNCHGHSDSCRFDAARFEASGGASGGVCDDCRDNREGERCERCRPFTFQDPRRGLDDPDGCIPCDCSPLGSESAGLCDAGTGQCLCKANVEGQRCDRCRTGHFGLRQDDPLGCQQCSCHPLGSAGPCDVQSGRCQCDARTVGVACDRCVPGHFGLANGQRCSPCDCDIGGAVSTTCDGDSGQCQCLPNMNARRCADPRPGYFLPQLDYFLYEAELAAPLETRPLPPPTPVAPPSPVPPPTQVAPPWPVAPPSPRHPIILPKCEQYYREQGYDFKISNGRVVLVRRTRRNARRRRQYGAIPLEPGGALQIVPRERTSGRPVTWTGLGLVRVLTGAGLRFTVDNLPLSMDYELVIRYEPESPSDWSASLSITTLSPGDQKCNSDAIRSGSMTLTGNSRGSVLDSPLCLNSGARYFIDVTFNKSPQSDPDSSSHILIDSLGLIPRLEAVPGLCSQTELDAFRRSRCVGLAAEAGPRDAPPEVCEGLVKSMSARIHKGALPCGCNPEGSVGPYCDKLGGACECKPNVIGRCCDSCAPQTYGFGPEGCKPCECDPRGSESELCDQTRGQCACRRGVSGRRCDSCAPGHWGFPHCRVCECNGLAELCHQETGHCIDCRGNAAGPHCDSCVEGFYGSPGARVPCEPCLCPDLLESGRFFASSCERDPETLRLGCRCHEGHTGPQCERCSPGYYGDLFLTGARCEKCDCNDNVDPNDGEACDRVSGECQRCLHNTRGRHCEECKQGYYGNALEQDCKECSCDRRGTEVTLCPLQSPCFCDARTGQCPCRSGVRGALCDECEDGYWNMELGCVPCSCDSANALSNACDKATGQCPCQPEYGGRKCDECGENHFGNPGLQCVSCDCNLEGTRRPSCDSETGECNCREGVTGIFCDECAPGHDTHFPECAECHACAKHWGHHVADVERAALTMRTFIPRPPDERRPGAPRHQERLRSLVLDLDKLRGNATRPSSPRVSQVEALFRKILKLKNSIDPHCILLDPTPLLNTEIDNIDFQFKNLLSRLRNKVENDEDEEDAEDLLENIKKSFKSFQAADSRVKNASDAAEDSADTRRKAKRKLDTCGGQAVGPLEDKVKALNVVDLNKQVCGGSGRDCSGCGGALCQTWLFGRKCGGPDCDGIVSLSQKALETAQSTRDAINALPLKIQQAKDEMERVNQTTKVQSKDRQDRIISMKDSFEKDKDQVKELIKKVKDYLLDNLLPAEDIEKMARAVLNINLPRTPDQIRAMIQELAELMNNAQNSGKDLKKLQDQARAAEELKERALELKARTKGIDVSDIQKDIYAAEKAQDKANDDLDAASLDRDTIRDQLQEMNDKLDEVEAKATERRLGDLKDEIEAVKNKTEQNRELAEEATEEAESALGDALDALPDLKDVVDKFDLLKDKKLNQTQDGEAAERLVEMKKEAEVLKKEVEDKLLQIEDLERWIRALDQRGQDRVAEVDELLKRAESLRDVISRRAEEYVKCP
ncbi:laminin subunit beta-4 [Eucyclogobius newberryi]|uniref:laminin subunit beta-4 n=1 Tax=Eucyclogobius newberryi TaxID=166745 RepID=UPI003B5BE902